MTESPLFYTAPEVAGMLRTSADAVYDALGRGEIRGFKFGSQWRISASELDRLQNTLPPGVDQVGRAVDADQIAHAWEAIGRASAELDAVARSLAEARIRLTPAATGSEMERPGVATPGQPATTTDRNGLDNDAPAGLRAVNRA